MPNFEEKSTETKIGDEMINSSEESDNNQIKVPSADPVVRFGLITDIQYADIEDGYSYDKKKKRFYRNSLNLVREAVKNWNERKSPPIKFILQLGDIIDGKCKSINESIPAMNKIIDELNVMFQNETTQPRVLHIWGNHEMYNFLRSDLLNLTLNTARYFNQNLGNSSIYYNIVKHI